MELKYGDILQMFSPAMGHILYMVLSSPIICEHCHAVQHGWGENDSGQVTCTHCGERIEFPEFPVCRCGESDLLDLTIAADNNFGLQSDGEMISYNHLVNKIYTFCRKDILKDIAGGKILHLSDREANLRKRLILWTSDKRYEPGKEMPEEIKNQFPV